MKIGILTYHNIPNFGANLQAYTSLKNILKLGINAKIINYSYQDLEKVYEKEVPEEQIDVHKSFIDKKYLTEKCKDISGLKKILTDEKFTHIIVGSDGMIRLRNKGTSDVLYPNPAWLNWIPPDQKVKKIFLSVSAMGSYYFLLNPIKILKIRKNLKEFDIITVRDRWTYWTLRIIGIGKINLKITPDPVSNLNSIIDLLRKADNYEKIIGTKKFVLFSGQKKNYSEKWLAAFKKVVNGKGFLFGELPMPAGYTGFKSFDFRVPMPLSPRDWYFWIVNSNGYVGERFHALVSCAYNKKRFFMVDIYCHKLWKYLKFQYKSKVYDFCRNIHQTENRVIRDDILREPPESVFEKLMTMDYAKSRKYLETSKIDFIDILKEIISLR